MKPLLNYPKNMDTEIFSRDLAIELIKYTKKPEHALDILVDSIGTILALTIEESDIEKVMELHDEAIRHSYDYFTRELEKKVKGDSDA